MLGQVVVGSPSSPPRRQLLLLLLLLQMVVLLLPLPPLLLLCTAAGAGVFLRHPTCVVRILFVARADAPAPAIHLPQLPCLCAVFRDLLGENAAGPTLAAPARLPTVVPGGYVDNPPCPGVEPGVPDES
jgi:hypothetical protein